ncbi:Uncharacterised protein [Legionella londiniensis]|nr:Uncharacterised protein [Legionella londiniensis]
MKVSTGCIDSIVLLLVNESTQNIIAPGYEGDCHG